MVRPPTEPVPGPAGPSANSRLPAGTPGAVAIAVAVAVAVAAALIFAACTASPGSSGAAAPTQIASVNQAHADPGLEARLPARVGDVPMVRNSVRASDLAGTPATAALTELAERLDHPLEDFTLASAADPTGGLAGGINAMRLRDGAGEVLLQAILLIEQRTVATEVSQVELGGRTVTRLAQTEGEATATRFLFASGDAVFIVLAPDTATAAALIDAIP